MTLLVPSKLSISLGAIRAAFATLIIYFISSLIGTGYLCAHSRENKDKT